MYQRLFLYEPGCPSENVIRIEPSGAATYFAYGRTLRPAAGGPSTIVLGDVQCFPSFVDV